MTKYFDIDGNEVPDVISKTEFEQKLGEEKQKIESEYKTKLDQSTVELNKNKEELLKAQEALKDENPNGENFKALREAVKAAEQKVLEANKNSENVRSELRANTVNSLIRKFSGNDAELEKKIKFNMENSLAGMKAENDDELSKKIEAAYKLSADQSSINPLRDVMGSGSYGSQFKNSKPVEFNEREKGLGSKLGISDKDREKYGTDPRINN